ncbi:MAG: T9SS type A sorting domain-containing protein [Bacteroidales bacterium]|nr:T9SS type A sorting domain-containing protein [Bacteroidales bacterium]MCF8327156.1 T9SS type A sorting domain-containing protein [Bacteroidales bacterium]
MRYFIVWLIFVFIFFPLINRGQSGPVNIIDSSSHTSGVSKLVSSDIDNNGFMDIVASFTGSSGLLAFYLNNGNNTFSSINIIDSIPFTKGVATGDFNGDGWVDIVSIGGTDFDVMVYFNNNGNFSSGIMVDSNLSIAVNDVEVADYNNDGIEDFVVIGQHSIDLFKNDGTGQFSKEPILTTSTSPKPLECLDLAKADMNGDGHIDLVCGETVGLVIYFNSGSGSFSPKYVFDQSRIVELVHTSDLDNDGDEDIVLKKSTGEVSWYSNDGTGEMTLEKTLQEVPDPHSITTINSGNGSFPNIYASYLNHVSLFLNDSNQVFTKEINIVKDNSLFMGPVSAIDIDNSGIKDYIWSGFNKIIAFNKNTGLVNTSKPQIISSLNIYPNPTKDFIYINTPENNEFAIKIFDLNGKLKKKLPRLLSGARLDISGLASGFFILKIIKPDGVFSRMLIVK